MNRSEVKYRNTEVKMYSALFELLETKSFNSINIKELCEKANINRSTFYSHYDSMLELLDDAKNYVLNQFFKSFKINLLNDNIPKNDIENFNINNFIIPYLNFVKENKLVFKVFVENLSTFNADKYYNFLLENVFIPLLSKKGIEDQLAIKYISKYYLSGVTSVVLDWINRNCIDDIDYVSNIIVMCNKYTIL